MERFLGFDIGGTKCAVVLGDKEGNILKKLRFETTDYQNTLQQLLSSGDELFVEEVVALGVSCGGPLNSKLGMIMSPPNLPGWDNVPIVQILQEHFKRPAFLKNDADACAIAEWKYGAGRGCENVVFLTFGTGMGAGLILGGRLYTGSSDMAGEIGHVRIGEYGPVGYGKCGSFEGFCSGHGIAQIGRALAMEQLQMGSRVSYCQSLEELSGITARSIAACADAGHTDARAVYERCAEKLGLGLSILMDLLNPDAIVIGSVYLRAEHLLRDTVMRVIERETLPLSRNVCKILPAGLGERLGDYAALSVAAEA